MTKYQVVRSVKQVNDPRPHLHVCEDSDEEKFQDAVALAEVLATTHARDNIVADPKKASDGEYWFFYSNGSFVTYFVKEVK